jgi:hypothetical protein
MEGEEGDGIATPVPLAATRPRTEQRFTVTGYPGVWRLVADLTSGKPTDLDITRPRGDDSILAALGERLVELEQERGSDF